MTRPAQIVILGASGDLTLRKIMPALVGAARAGKGAFAVVGVARSDLDDDAFRARVRAALPDDDARAAFAELAPRVHYQAADVADDASLEALARRLDELAGGEDVGRLFYLALKPDLFSPTVAALAKRGLLPRACAHEGAFRRIVVEKPFGHDLASARRLNEELHALLDEAQIFRIDHYLGKETVQNLLGFRFHNAIFEPIWNRHHVELVQITVAEDIGVADGRAAFYDETGAVRDVVQNHMLQVLALVAMEPPVSLSPEALRDQKVQVLRALRAPSLEDVARHSVRGQYAAGEVGGRSARAYLDEEGVPEGSATETYAAVRASIEAWRWSGVPFILRHGKRLGKKFTEVQVQFRTPPLQLFNRPAGMEADEFERRLRDGSLCQIRPNVLTLSLQPREAISLAFGVKRPGPAMVMSPALLDFDYRDAFDTKSAPAYERLLLDALAGDATLFLRADEIEASWRFADAIRDGWEATDAPLHRYAAGSDGPEAAATLFDGCEGGWSRG